MGFSSHDTGRASNDDLSLPATDNSVKLLRRNTDLINAVRVEQNAQDAAPQSTDTVGLGLS